MKKILLVARYEFLTNIRKKSFLMAAIGMPLFFIGIMLLVMVLSIVSIQAGEAKGERVGYVDTPQILGDTPTIPDTYRAYADEASGRKALDDKDIDMLAVIDTNYLKTGKVSFYADGSLSNRLKNGFEDVLTTNLAHNLTDNLPEERVKDPVNIQYYMEKNGRLFNELGLVTLIVTPMVFVMVFMIALQLTGTYLMTSIVEEKTNRIMEILATSVTPTQLLAGKLIGVGGLGLVQIGIWLIVIVVGLIAGQGTDLVEAIRIPFDLVVISVAYFILNYFLFGSILAGIGVVVGSEQESRQFAGLVTTISVIPLILSFLFLVDPDGPGPVFLSLFPFTAPMAMQLRLMLGVVSPLELILSFSLMILTTVITVWIAARVFRWAMLLYGKRLTPRELWRVIVGRADSTAAPLPQEGR